VLDALWLTILVVMEGWALWSGQGPLTLVASLGLLVSASLLLTRWAALAGVTCRHHLSTNRANFGDVVEFTVELMNLKPLPLTWLRVEDSVPKDLPIEGGRIETDLSGYFRQFVMLIAMLPYERLVRRLRVRCNRRGEYKFGPVRLESGDYLGVLTAYGSVRLENHLLIFPKVLLCELDRLPSQLLIGRDAVRRMFLPDPMQVVGARAYQFGDPYRLIDWRATAKASALMVRILQPSSTPVLDIVLDFAGPLKDEPDYTPDELELAISVVASLARFAAERRMAVGVRGNGRSRHALLDVSPSARDDQFVVIMETLAYAETLPSFPLGQLLARPAPQIPSGATTVIVTAGLRDDLVASLLEFQRKRRPCVLVYVGHADAAVAADGIPVLRVTYDKGWSGRETLVLAA
jgi:uncharacterized repeat protein (TIGR01451 family)